MPKETLNPNQRMFCQHYAGGGELFGNGVWSYIMAYKIDVPLVEYGKLNEQQKKDYETSSVSACDLLTNPKIKNYCNDLIDALIKDKIVDRELARVIQQNNELSPKVSAIKEYNAVRGRVKNTLEHTLPQNLIDILKQAYKNGKQTNKTTNE